MKRIRRIIILLLLVGLVVGGFSIYRNMKFQEKKAYLTSSLEESVVDLEELSTVSYNYTNIAEYKNNMALSGINIPFTKKTFLVKYSGYLKAGIDQLEFETFDEDLGKVRVIMGRPKVLDNVIIEEEVYFYNEKDSAFNRLKFDELYELLKDEKSKTEKEILDKGFLNDAEKNARKILENYLASLGFEDIEFVLED